MKPCAVAHGRAFLAQLLARLLGASSIHRDGARRGAREHSTRGINCRRGSAIGCSQAGSRSSTM